MSDAKLEEFCEVMSEAVDLSVVDPQAGHDAAIDCIKIFLATLDDGRFIDLAYLLGQVRGMYSAV